MDEAGINKSLAEVVATKRPRKSETNASSTLQRTTPEASFKPEETVMYKQEESEAIIDRETGVTSGTSPDIMGRLTYPACLSRKKRRRKTKISPNRTLPFLILSR
jgi:hypothetical protein